MKENESRGNNITRSKLNADNSFPSNGNFVKVKPFLDYKVNHIIKFNLIVHNSTEEEYNIKVINDIIYNEDKRVVSKFKDHLIFNDPAEFLRW